MEKWIFAKAFAYTINQTHENGGQREKNVGLVIKKLKRQVMKLGT